MIKIAVRALLITLRTYTSLYTLSCLYNWQYKLLMINYFIDGRFMIYMSHRSHLAYF